VRLSIARIRYLMWKELIELRGDPRLFGILILAPLIQLFLLAYAATTDVRNVPVIVADADRSGASRALVQRFVASRIFTVVDVVTAVGETDRFLESGDAWLAVAIPPGFGADVAAGRGRTVQLVAGVALAYASNLIAGHAQVVAAELAGRRGAAESTGALEARVRVWFNPRLESRDFMVPGVVALLLLVVTTNLSSMGVVREKELGTLEQLNVTPLGRFELILGKLLPYALIGVIDVVLVLTVAVWWFEVPLRGSVVLLFAMSLIYLLTTLGLGLFVSTISSTQQQAMMTSTFFFLMPMVLLSGFVFPIENMPAVIQPVTFLIPLRYFLVILRSVFLKGVGLETVWPQALALTAWGVAILALAVARSTKRSS
jgi:ABC-2 type transport system permease protein